MTAAILRGDPASDLVLIANSEAVARMQTPGMTVPILAAYLAATICKQRSHISASGPTLTSEGQAWASRLKVFKHYDGSVAISQSSTPPKPGFQYECAFDEGSYLTSLAIEFHLVG